MLADGTPQREGLTRAGLSAQTMTVLFPVTALLLPLLLTAPLTHPTLGFDQECDKSF